MRDSWNPTPTSLLVFLRPPPLSSLQIVWPQYYGKACLGVVSGSSMTSAVLGSALGPLVWGYAYDHLTTSASSDILGGSGEKDAAWGDIIGWTIPWALATGLLTWTMARKPQHPSRRGSGTPSGAGGDMVYAPVSLNDKEEGDVEMEEVSFDQ